MGAGGSIPTHGLNATPVCNPQETQLQLQPNVLHQEEVTLAALNKDNVVANNNDVSVLGEEQWLIQIQDLGKVIQNLASENVRLLNSNKEWKRRSEALEGKHDRSCEKPESSGENEQTINDLKEEVAKGKVMILDLKLQLQTKTESNASEVEKYHENMQFMKMKLKEYEQVVLKLEKDATSQNSAIQTLQNSITCACNETKTSKQNVTDMEEAFNRLKQELKEVLGEKNSLCKEVEEARNSKESIIQENKKLFDELQQIKQTYCESATQRLPETSEVDLNNEAESSTSGGDAEKNEETKTLSPRAAAELEVFQKQLRVKREARHKALSAISGEMERLRRELNTEREARRNVTKELEELKNVSSAHHLYDEVNDLKKLLSTESQAKDKVFKEMVQVQKQGNEEIENILKELEKEKDKSEQILKENKHIREQFEESDQALRMKCEENSELLNKLEADKEKYQLQIAALKEVISLTKQMLTVRENQVTHMKNTIQDIEASTIQKHHGSLAADLKAEYETQIENIKALKALYEERTHVMKTENEKLLNKQNELEKVVEEEKTKVEDLELKLQEKDMLISERNTTVSNLQDQLSGALDQSKNLSDELTLINNMFTQILGSSGVDLDRLTKLLQENHDLITEITTKGECSETTASLPKLLLDLVSGIEDADNRVRSDKEPKIKETRDSVGETSEPSASDTTQSEHKEEEKVSETIMSGSGSGATLAMQDISSNLPKVWRVLLELISHHVPSTSDETTEELKTTCYKSVETPYGPKNVISVSKTFLRLRDLILQKKSLQKEVTRLKQLNVHLETKLNDQERRLSIVSTELRKTWNVVDHMRIQHQQLHTHEKVLRYELQQKRKLLNELKEELEYCREKWDDARQKNSQSEIEWQKLRTEFALRKSKPNNNSGESGFSEEKEDDVTDVDIGKLHPQPLPMKSEDSPSTGNVETINSSSSLPDLLSVTTDISGSQPEVSSVVIPANSNDSLSNLPNMVPEALAFDSGSNSTLTDNSVLEDCPTESLISLLKQELSYFSKNLEIITAGFDSNDHFRALQSIFTLPAIQIPDHLNSTSCETQSVSNDNKNIVVNVAGTESSSFPEENPNVCDDRNKSLPNYLDETMDIKSNIMDESNCSVPPNHCSEHSETQDAPPCVFPATEDAQVESRSARIHRLEKQCKELFDKVTQGTTKTSDCVEKEAVITQEGSNGSSKSLEDMLDARAARLKRLEEQSQQLFKKVKRTTHRSEALSNRLEELHEQYGTDETPSTSRSSPLNNVPVPPPLPCHLLSSGNGPSREAESPDISAPSTSNSVPTPPLEEVLDARAARLKRLEEQSQQLFKKVKQTTNRSEALSNRLEELHEQYRSDEATSTSVEVTTVNQSTNNTLVSTPLTDYEDQQPNNITNNCGHPDLQSSSLLNSISTSPPPELPILVEESSPQRISASNIQENDPHIPPPPPVPVVFPIIRLPSEIEEAEQRFDTLERIQNAEEDPT